MSNELMQKIDLLHTTELGAERIKRNLELTIDTVDDVIEWCKEKTLQADKILRRGKNWYVYVGEVVITVNAHSYTIITAHKKSIKFVGVAADPAQSNNNTEMYSQEELQEALRAIRSTISKCEEVLPKLNEGKSQHTLTVRRIKALQIAVSLITRELEDVYGKETS